MDTMKTEGLMETKKATEIVVGDYVVESDGSFFEVSSVAKAGRRMVFGLKNINGYMVAPGEARVMARALVRTLGR